MNQKVKVSFYLKRNEEKEDGGCPVMARLTVGGTESVFSAKLNALADLSRQRQGQRGDRD